MSGKYLSVVSQIGLFPCERSNAVRRLSHRMRLSVIGLSLANVHSSLPVAYFLYHYMDFIKGVRILFISC